MENKIINVIVIKGNKITTMDITSFIVDSENNNSLQQVTRAKNLFIQKIKEIDYKIGEKREQEAIDEGYFHYNNIEILLINSNIIY